MSLHKVVVVVLLLISLVAIHIESALGADRGLENEEKCGKKSSEINSQPYRTGKQIKARRETW